MGATALARLVGDEGQYPAAASLTAIRLKVFDLDWTTPDAPVYDQPVSVPATIFDALQAGPADLRIWTVDDVGFNFRHHVPASAFPRGVASPRQLRRYEVEYEFTPAVGQPFPLVFDAEALNLRSKAEA